MDDADGDVDSGDEVNHARRGGEEEDAIDDEDQVCPVCDWEHTKLTFLLGPGTFCLPRRRCTCQVSRNREPRSF